MTETLCDENILAQKIREKLTLLPDRYQNDRCKILVEWRLWEIGLQDIKYKQVIRLPPFSECRFDVKECEDCGDAYVCPIRTMEIVCPNCGKKGFTSFACEESGWRYVCLACDHPFDRY